MSEKIWKLLLLTLVGQMMAELSFAQPELNEACRQRSSCSNAKKVHTIDWDKQNCMCDQECAQHGDCCQDSPHFEITEQLKISNSYECLDFLTTFHGVYVKTSCPPEWSDQTVRTACEVTNEDSNDPLAGIPVTSNKTRITYRNMFCAICHNDYYDFLVWNFRIECEGVSKNLSQENITKYLKYSKYENSWGIFESKNFFTCKIRPSVPDNNLKLFRQCIPLLTRSCPENWTDDEIANKCETFTSVVYDTSISRPYKNSHCALCNNVTEENIQCSLLGWKINIFPVTYSPTALSVLFDLRSQHIGKIALCKENELYDPFFKKCRHIISELQTNKHLYESNDPRKIPDDVIIEIESKQNKSNTIETCTKFLLENNDFIEENNSIYVPVYEKQFEKGQFILRPDKRVEICAEHLGTKFGNKFGSYMGYATFAGLGISIFFLVLHLTAFSIVKELRNLSGKNLASLCVSLLIAHISFITGQLFYGSTTPCFVSAIITFYGFLTSFMWMCTMAFDVWRTLRLTTTELRVHVGKQWKKFFVYSIWSWMVPAIIVGIALWTDLTPINIPDEWRPNFAVYSCWFGGNKPLLVFFAGPLAVIMILNIFFFISSAYMIYKTTSITKFTTNSNTKRDFKLYIRLVVVMGLTWTMGIFAGTFDVKPLWYVFIALNTLQGLFIFLAFTWTDKVIHSFTSTSSTDNPLHLPHITWSSNSTQNSPYK